MSMETLMRKILNSHLRQETELRDLCQVVRQQQQTLQTLLVTCVKQMPPSQQETPSLLPEPATHKRARNQNTQRQRRKKRNHRASATSPANDLTAALQKVYSSPIPPPPTPPARAPSPPPVIRTNLSPSPVVSISSSTSSTSRQDDHVEVMEDSDSDYHDDGDTENNEMGNGGNNCNDSMEIIPRLMYYSRSSFQMIPLSRISNDMILTTLKQYFVPRNGRAAADLDDGQLHHQALILFEEMTHTTASTCLQELTPPVYARSFYQLPQSVSKWLVYILEQNMKLKDININRAEDHWLTKFFLTRYFNSKK